MSVLWCGGEDIDFPVNTGAYSVSTTATSFRSGYARCSLLRVAGGGVASGTTFPGGAITSGWFACRFVVAGGLNTSEVNFGIGLSGGNGFFLGTGSASSSKLTLWGLSGGTFTVLAAESGNSLFSNGVFRVDMQFSSLAGSPTVNVFVNGTLLITYSGALSVASVNCVRVGGQGLDPWAMSEFMVASDDTRSRIGVVTMAPNGNGTTQNWSNPASTNFNPITINDANATFVNTTAQDEQANLIDLPTGTFGIEMVKVVARALATSGATATQVALGVRNGATAAVGSPHALATSFAPVEDYFANDPTTSAAWLQADMNGLQLNLRSA